MALVDVNWQPSRRELRRFAGLWLPAFLGLIGGVVFYKSGSWVAATTIWSVGCLVAAAGLASPVLARHRTV